MDSAKDPRSRRSSPPAQVLPELPLTFRCRNLGPLPPHVYLPLSLVLLLLLVLAALLFYPGLWRPKGWLEIETLPQGALVYIDDTLYGSTPLRVQVPAGEHRIRLEKQFFAVQNQPVLVPRQRMAQLFSQPRVQMRINLSIKENNNYNLLRFYWQDAVYRGLEAESLPTFGASYASPPLLQRAMRDLLYSDAKVETSILTALLQEKLTTVTNRAQLADLLIAALITRYPRQQIGPRQLLDFGRYLRTIPVDNEVMRRWQQHVLPPSWQQLVQDWPADKVQKVITQTSPDQPLEIAGGVFLPVQVPGQQPFYFQQAEVSYRQFAPFIAANPDWGPRRKPSSWEVEFPPKFGHQQASASPWLAYENDLVSRDYLSSWPDEKLVDIIGNYPVAHVDFAAARQFASWMNQQLPSSMRALWQVDLPSAAEWRSAVTELEQHQRTAATHNRNFPPPIISNAGTKLLGTEGSLLEWTRDPYRPYPFFAVDDNLAALLDWLNPPLRVLQGSAWLADQQTEKQVTSLLQNNIDLAGHAEQTPVFPATLASPFLGFRLVIRLIER